MRASTWALTGALVFISNPSVIAQNLAVNGEFDTDISGWTPMGADLSAEWHPSDHASNPASGSLLATNTAPVAASLAVVSCVDSIPDDQLYRYSGWINVPPGQTASGQVELFWYWYALPSCAGTQALAGATTIVVGTSGWESVSTAWEAAPPGTMSAWLVVGNYKTQVGAGSFQAYYDGLYFRGDRVFSDGFETGNTGAWDATVPVNCEDQFTHTAILEYCTQSGSECTLRANTLGGNYCDVICQHGGGFCVAAFDDNPNGTCNLGMPVTCNSDGLSSMLCICSR